MHRPAAILGSALAVILTGACVFELGEVVVISSTGGAGGMGGAGGGVGGSGATGGGTTATRTRIRVSGELLDTDQELPILVRLTPAALDYELAGPTGDGIRFYVDTESTPLAHEIESWKPGGESLVWVRAPVAAAVDNELFMHVGDGSDPSPPTSVWVDYAAVYHLADSLPGMVLDSSPNARHGSSNALVAEDTVEAIVGSGIDFKGMGGASPSIDLGSDAAFRVDLGNALSVELWFQRDDPPDSHGYMLSMEGCCAGWGVTWVSTPLQMRGLLGLGGCCPAMGAEYVYNQWEMPNGDAGTPWHHYVLVLDRQGNTLSGYLDGALVEADAFTPTLNEQGQGTLRIGANFAGENGFEGRIDEVRFRPGVQPADRIAFEHAMLTTNVVTVETPEPLP